jgi:putative DNA primase/helicase
MHDVKALAMNKWPQILEAAGIGSDFLRDVHGPCPVCGGKDRFRFDDLEGTGSYYCNNPHHGAGDGIKLLMTYRDCSFKEAAKFIEDQLGHMPVEAIHRPVPMVSKKRDDAKIRVGLQKVAHACFRVTRGDAVWKYLLGTRGLELSEIPRAIKIHPRLGYYERDKKGEKMVKVGEYPAMIAVISGPDGTPVSLHRTYLTMSGQKAPVTEPKKVMSILKGDGKHGGAIRLYPAGKVLAVAEGIETALAVHLLTGYPVWATISASWMKSLVIPSYVEKVLIFADNDAPDKQGVRAGQESAAALKSRLEGEGKEVSVILPKREGTDFADVWFERVLKGQQIAA